MPKNLDKELSAMIGGFERSDQHVIITDLKGIIVYANKAAEQHTGFTRKEMIGKKPGALWGGKMSDDFYRDMWACIRDHKQCFVGDVQNVKKDGTMYWQEIHIVPIIDATGEAKFFIGIELDTNESQRRERLLQECHSSSEICNRLKIRWPLDWLFEAGNLSQEQLLQMQDSYRDEKVLDALTDDLLAISNVVFASKRPPEDFCVLELLQQVVRDVNEHYPDRNYSINHNGDSYVISERKLLLAQLLERIIMNAAQYSAPDVGTITIMLLKTGNQIVVKCDDNGIGISFNDQRRIFQKFFRGTQARSLNPRGSGLGLYLAKAIADSCRWSISCVSEPERGASFELRIPVVSVSEEENVVL